MLIQFDSETSGTALGGNEPLSRSHMRDGASRNPVYFRAVVPAHPFVQLLRDIAPVLALALFFLAFGVVAAVIKALVFGA